MKKNCLKSALIATLAASLSACVVAPPQPVGYRMTSSVLPTYVNGQYVGMQPSNYVPPAAQVAPAAPPAQAPPRRRQGRCCGRQCAPLCASFCSLRHPPRRQRQRRGRAACRLAYAERRRLRAWGEQWGAGWRCLRKNIEWIKYKFAVKSRTGPSPVLQVQKVLHIKQLIII